MRKLWLALVAMVALSIGIAWAEGQKGKGGQACSESTACCCCEKVCPK
jgi:hypothetical protein